MTLSFSRTNFRRLFLEERLERNNPRRVAVVHGPGIDATAEELGSGKRTRLDSSVCVTAIVDGSVWPEPAREFSVAVRFPGPEDFRGRFIFWAQEK
jgi:hypothetical protein